MCFSSHEMAFKPLTVSRCPVLHWVVLHFPGKTGHLATLKALRRDGHKKVYLDPSLQTSDNLKYQNRIIFCEIHPMSDCDSFQQIY